MSTFTSCPIPGSRDRLSDCYSTMSGGTKITYDRKFLLECKNLLMAWTPPCYLPQTPGVTVLPQAPLAKLEELKEQKEIEKIPAEAQFEMDN